MSKYFPHSVLATAGLPGLRAGMATAAEPASCKAARFSDAGWTDITSTTAITGAMLKAIGYAPKTTILGVPMTCQSLKNKDIGVFLGNWMAA